MNTKPKNIRIRSPFVIAPTNMSREDILQEMSSKAGSGTVVPLTSREVKYYFHPSDAIRKFGTGATRDTDNGKHDPEGFLSPLVIDRYNEFMHENRVQKDGSYRDSDNWQKGIPLDAYAKSMWRHFLDFWMHHRKLNYNPRETLEVALCAIIFNASGYLHEILKKNEHNSRANDRE